MNTNDLCDLIARSTGLPFSDVQLFARRLRESGFMPQGSRGRAAPPVGPEHAANLLVALLVTDIARQAPVEITHYEPLRKRLTHTLGTETEAQKFAGMKVQRRAPRVCFVHWWEEPDALDITESALDSSVRSFEVLGPTGLGRAPHHSEMYPKPTDPTRLTVNAELDGDIIVQMQSALAEGGDVT